MEKRTITIDGSDFSDIEGFYDAAYGVLTSGLDWTPAHNLDALNDILYGGFGAFEGDEEIILKWVNYGKSRQDLGKAPSISYYEGRAAGLSGKRADYFRNLADELSSGSGESLIETITGIIGEHPKIDFITE